MPIPGRDGALRRRINIRRRHVSAILLRNPTLTLAEVAEQLEVAGVINPETEKRYSHQVVHQDLKIITEDWQKRSTDDIGKMKGRQLAELDEMRKAAYIDGDREFVLKLMQHESKLLGLDSPLMIEHFASFDMTSWQSNRDDRLAAAGLILDDVEQPKLRRTETTPKLKTGLDDEPILNSLYGKDKKIAGIPASIKAK